MFAKPSGVSSRHAGKLHVTNGDSVVYLFRKAGIIGTYLPWRDALHEGPVPSALSHQELSRVRAGYMAARSAGNPIKVFHEFEERDATVARAGEYDEVVLWFEHDLYDQLQLLQVLSWLAELELDPGRVSLISSAEYLGSMTVDELSALYPKRKTVTKAVYDAARDAWKTFRSADALALAALTKRDAPGMPHLRSGIARLIEEFPWKYDGLSRSARQALQAVSQGPGRNDELFRRAQAREEAPFLGDAMFYALLRDLAADPEPLIQDEGDALVPTARGRRVLAGDADWLEAPREERWIGGVRVDGTLRYDDDAAALVPNGGAVDA